MMKVFVVILAGAVLLSSLACKGRSVQTNEENVPDSIPEVLHNDSLLKNNIVEISDTFDTGEPLKVIFTNKENPEKIYEKKYYKSGSLFMEGELLNNRRNGKWVAWYENEVIWSVGYYSEGLKQGESAVYYPNGQVRYTKNYDRDVAEGLWKFYDDDGTLLGEIMYENGKVIWQKGTVEN